jgi:formyl-CoA transferase
MSNTATSGPAARFPLDGVRVLALEQMQSVPYATQLLARLGADVLKVEPLTGESGRHGRPAMADETGTLNGCTFLRNNLGKHSIAVDLKAPGGRDLVLALSDRYDILAQNYKAGALDRLGLGYEALAARNPSVIYLSVSGFGVTTDDGYRSWPAYAPIAEAMAGLYTYRTPPEGVPPVASPMGALGDTVTALFGAIGVLAALNDRTRTGLGQHIDLGMYDALVAINDAGVNYWSMGVQDGVAPIINDAFRARDGWFVVEVPRRHMFEALARIVGCPEWIDDPSLADGVQWRAHLEDRIRPAVERWAAPFDRDEACDRLGRAGIAAGPVRTAGDVIQDRHLRTRNMIVPLTSTDGRSEPVLAVGNPLKLSSMVEDVVTTAPRLGQHTDEVLGKELGLDRAEIDQLRARGVVA